MTQTIQFPKLSSDMNVNFGSQFMHSPTKGRDFSAPIGEMPDPLVISVPEEGMTDNEFLEHQRKQQNKRNAINAASEVYMTYEAGARLHATAYKAQGAAINAHTEWQNVRGAYATHRSAVSAANYAELKADVDAEKYQVQGQTLLVDLKQAQVTLSKATLDLLQTGFDLITHRTIRGLNGVNTENVPEIQYEELKAQLPPADFKTTIDIGAFMDKFKQQTQSQPQSA